MADAEEMQAAELPRDIRIILTIQGLRAFAYGFASVLLGVVLAAARFSDLKVGAILTAMLAGMALTSIAVGRWGERVGRRRLYGSLLALMGVAGAVFALTRWFPALLLAALSGTLSPDPNESGPITSLEQAMIGGVRLSRRVRAFGRYNAVAFAAGSVGSLAAGLPALLRKVISGVPSNQWWLLMFPVIGVVCRVLAARLSPAVEVGPAPATLAGKPAPLVRSRATVRKLAALFALDSFGGGFITQTFLVFWFGRALGASTGLLAVVFFVAGILQAGSSMLASPIAARIGLLNTMVFSHLPSNLALMAVPLAPNLPIAVAILMARFAISQMDVPARQAYVVTMVDPEERVAASAYTNTARYLTRPVAPSIGGALMSHVGQGSPFFAAGGLKILYDILIYFQFRKVPDPGKAQRHTP
jgi:predicted MFS family arabinose efflux permease